MESPEAPSLSGWFERLGMDEVDVIRVYRTFRLPEIQSAPRASREKDGENDETRTIRMEALTRVEGEE